VVGRLVRDSILCDHLESVRSYGTQPEDLHFRGIESFLGTEKIYIFLIDSSKFSSKCLMLGSVWHLTDYNNYLLIFMTGYNNPKMKGLPKYSHLKPQEAGK